MLSIEAEQNFAEGIVQSWTLLRSAKLPEWEFHNDITDFMEVSFTLWKYFTETE